MGLDQTNDFKIRPTGQLPPGYRNKWSTWKTLYRLRVDIVQTKNKLHKWGYNIGSTESEYGSKQKQTEQHIVTCPSNSVTCTFKDMINASDTAINLAKQWSRKEI